MEDEEKKPQRPFMTAGEIIKVAGIHPQSLYYWRVTGKIVPIDKVGSMFLYDREDVMKFIEKRNEQIKRDREIYMGTHKQEK